MKPKYKVKKFKRRGELKSGLEIDVQKQLKKAKVKFTYEQHPLPYVKEHTYWCDFKVGEIFIEVKGYFKGADRSKMLAVKQANPSVDIRFLFKSNNKINKNSKTRYSDWCDKHGFKYAFVNVPKEWLKE